MIIQLLGANGAGKSTVVSEIMGLRSRVPMYGWGRLRPIGYVLDDVVVAGHYEGQACGGGDTLPRDRVQEVLRLLREHGKPVLIEGPTGREPVLAGDVRVVYLRKPAQACLGNWINRQMTKGLRVNDVAMERRVRSTIARCERMVDEYREEGIEVNVVTKRADCVDVINMIIGRKHA